jgi:predicted O-linked N-acetylglucosamine transferase (SPINDLY family)
MTGRGDGDHKRGIALHEAGDFQGALAAFDTALTLEPDAPRLHYSRANTLAVLNRLEQAIAAYEACIQLDPSHISARYNRATVHARLQRWADVLEGLDQTLSRAPNMADAWNNRAGALQALGRHEDALASIAQVLRLRPNDAAAFYNAGIMLLALNRFEEAVQAFERTLQLNPSHADAFGCLGSAALRACDWSRLETLTPLLLAAISQRKVVVPPLTLLAISDDPMLQRRCAEINVQRSLAGTALENQTPPPLWDGTIYHHPRLRIGYMSSDFRDHPVANQLAALLERHDRTRFEIIGFANGRPDNGAMRQRIVKACDQFHDIGGMGTPEAARLIRALEVDVLVDLNGQTLGWRPGIFKYRPAPVSAAWLGYAGTTGADFMDYVIGDAHVTPDELAPAMSEKIVQLPHSFWPSDPGLPHPRKISRAEAGLPEKSFVFCCFNSNHKIRPEIFDSWMRLLRAVPDSVLWIREASPAINRHFQNEAEKRGVAGSRIAFARRMESFAKHLDRMHQADLFLDTFPYNAHATASDALWAGVPVVTLCGKSFAARVAAGFLANLGLEELVTSSIEDYEALALSLAQNPARLSQVREHLWRARTTTPLFEVDVLARDLERAYAEMVNRIENGAQPFELTPLTV